ncbi:MAG: hypothetical protein GY696_24405 [Gammaproteobacteria bacterium]|nr:hypothetical protein [Gammaproteobacteria bacterium]
MFAERRTYVAAVNTFITMLKYANKWMKACKSRQQRGVDPAAEAEELAASEDDPKLPRYVVAAHTFSAANLQVAEKEKFRDEKYNSLIPCKVTVKLKWLLPAVGGGYEERQFNIIKMR